MRKELYIASLIYQSTGIDVFKNTRKREYVEFRALYNYILHKIMNKSLTWIRDNYIENGKNYDHATVIHSLNMFDVYSKYNEKIMPLFNELCQVNTSISERIAFIDTALKNMRYDEVQEVSDLVKKLLTQNLEYEAAKNIEVQAEPVEA